VCQRAQCIAWRTPHAVGARTALHLAEMGATVVLACRKGQAERAKAGIVKELSERGVAISADKLEV
jgi:glycine/D-amino acid oxidase-like deaminating enzyme